MEANQKVNRVLRRLRTTRWLVLHASLYVLLNAAFVAVWLMEVKSTGDGILATFDSLGAAIRCATALRDRLQQAGIEIRAGLHSGEIQPRGADVGGIAVHVAARVMGAAGDGEVLVSRTVRDLVAGSDVALEARGSYALKGIAGHWQPFAIRRQQTREVPP